MVGGYDRKGFKAERKNSDTAVSVRIARAGDVGYIRSLSRTAFHEYGPYEEMLPDWFASGITVTLLALIQPVLAVSCIDGRANHAADHGRCRLHHG